MICTSCRSKRHDHCSNLYSHRGTERVPPTTTHCDCQHKFGVYLGQEFCGHHFYEHGMLFCPSCGKVMDDQTDPIGETTAEPNKDQSTQTESAKVTVLDPETERDQRDNFVTEEKPGKQRGIASERHPQTPSR